MSKEHDFKHTPQTSTNSRRAAAFVRATRGAIASAAVTAAFVSALVLAAPNRSDARTSLRPQDRPNIANEVKKTEKKEETEAARPADANKSQNGKRTRGGGGTRPVASYEVKFKTDLPDAEIFLKRGSLGMQSLGKTNADGSLTVRLPRGRHDIVASRPGSQIQRLQIDVQPDSTDFNFNIALPAAPEKKETEEVAAVAPAEDAAAKSEQTDGKPSVILEDVVRRFLDAKETEALADGDWQQAHAQARAALDREPDNKHLRAQSMLAEGQVAYLRGDHASALVSFNKAALTSPDYVAAHYALGNAYLATNQPAEAFKAYQRAAALDKDLALAYKGMGDSLTKQGKSREATNYYNRAKSFGQTLPTNTGLTSARELKRRKRWADAVREFEEIARTEPSAEVFIDIGDCYVGLEQPLSASKAYLRATELDPKAALAFYKYGEVMFKLREYAAAMESLERALALDTTGSTFNRKQARERANEAAKKLGQKKDN